MEADGAVIRLVTRCTSAEEFIERFARFTTETDIVVPALPHLTAGAGGQFMICLKDRSVMMKGRCEVLEIRPVAVAPGAAAPPSLPALMRLRLREMDAHSCGIHLRLMERHASSSRASAVPEAVPAAMAVPDVSAVTVVREGRPPSDTEPTVISPAPRPEMRMPGAAFTLPANPLSDLDAADLASFVEHTLAPPGPAARWHSCRDGARRIARHLWPYAWCVVGGLLVGFAFRPASQAAPVDVAPEPASPPVAAPPSTASAPVDDKAEVPRPITTERGKSAVVAERLVPPPASVVAPSSPPRAVSKLKKRRVGSASHTRASPTPSGGAAAVAAR